MDLFMDLNLNRLPHWFKRPLSAGSKSVAAG